MSPGYVCFYGTRDLGPSMSDEIDFYLEIRQSAAAAAAGEAVPSAPIGEVWREKIRKSGFNFD